MVGILAKLLAQYLGYNSNIFKWSSETFFIGLLPPMIYERFVSLVVVIKSTNNSLYSKFFNITHLYALSSNLIYCFLVYFIKLVSNDIQKVVIIVFVII